MNNIPQDWQSSLALGTAYTVAQFSSFLPRIVGALLVFFIGLLVARFLKHLIVKALEGMRLSKAVEKTPLELFLTNAEFGQKIEGIIGSVFYWLFLFVILHTSISLLGLTPLSNVMDQILEYIPHVFSALLIFVFGVLIAGFVESVVKGSMRSIDINSGRLFAKVASYVVVVIASLAAVSELGIASDFIRILFLGVVFTFALGAGLALGLGGQDLIRKILDTWYKRNLK
jgi:hypothetical protein